MLIAITLLASPAVGQVAGAAPGRNCVLDEDALMAKSSVAAAIAGRFRTVREAAQRSYDADERALEADERAFAGQPGTGDAATRRRLDLAARRDALRQRGEQVNRDLADLDKELTRNVVRLSLPTIRKVGAERRCAMVVARSSLVDLADTPLDISARVIEVLNAAAPPKVGGVP